MCYIYCKRYLPAYPLWKERIRSIDTQILSDRYEIVSVLGTGVTSTVYLARHLKLKTYRAIKCISKTHSLPSSIFSEAHLIEHLRHPGIPIIYDLEEDDSYYYIIEEFITGESLEDILLQKETISQDYIMQIGIQICQILTFLHHHKPYPILYQDLKPSHIIVCGNQVKIIDFGIASYITSQGKNFQKFGTKGYAAPEQYTDSRLLIQSDIYELGQIFRLFLEKHNQKCSKTFRYIIWKSTKKNPNKRYASAEALEAALIKARKVDEYRKGYLLEEISIVGANPGAGATHIALSLTNFINSRQRRKGVPAVYIEQETDHVLDNLLKNGKSAALKEDIVQYRNLRGRKECHDKDTWQEYSPGVPQMQHEIRIYDFGYNRNQAVMQEADCTILVLNLSVWQLEAALKAYEQVKYMKHLLVVCNYGNRQEAKKFAAQIGRCVYCYPLEVNPFGESKEKTALFTQMLREKEEL